MSTVFQHRAKDIHAENSMFSSIRTTIETAFFGNNVQVVHEVANAYEMAKSSPGTIVTDLPIYKPESYGLPEEARVLLFNDGAVKGRCAAARRIVGEPRVHLGEYEALLREAVHGTHSRKMYHAESYVGLDEDFAVKAHLLIPEGYENTVYNWLINFQCVKNGHTERYQRSVPFEGEGDILVFADPDWTHPDFPLGLTFFDTEHNTAAILGMRYFGEFKKGTLTLAWGIANRNGFAACHGGLKRYNLSDEEKFVIGFFGLSGSGKSTLTHAPHKGKYDVTVLHDDAFIINVENGTAVAMEPSYFDKTADYPLISDDNRYLLSLQNCGATITDEGKIVPVMEDIRNTNGRALKSKLWSPNRVNKFEEPVNAIVWLMKDDALPPILKVKNPALASAMGATLATKRTSAERLAAGVDPNALVIEPYANPFRTYPLGRDYDAFKKLFEDGVDCYILNTGNFLGLDVKKNMTLDILERIIEKRADFIPWGPFEYFEILPIEGFEPKLMDESYKELLRSRMKARIDYIERKAVERGGFDRIRPEATKLLQEVVNQLIWE